MATKGLASNRSKKEKKNISSNEKFRSSVLASLKEQKSLKAYEKQQEDIKKTSTQILKNLLAFRSLGQAQELAFLIRKNPNKITLMNIYEFMPFMDFKEAEKLAIKIKDKLEQKSISLFHTRKFIVGYYLHNKTFDFIEKVEHLQKREAKILCDIYIRNPTLKINNLTKIINYI